MIRRTLNQSHSILNVELLEGSFRSSNHLRAQLQGDDLSLGVLGTLVPGNSAVSAIRANFKNYCGQSVLTVFVSQSPMGDIPRLGLRSRAAKIIHAPCRREDILSASLNLDRVYSQWSDRVFVIPVDRCSQYSLTRSAFSSLKGSTLPNMVSDGGRL